MKSESRVIRNDVFLVKLLEAKGAIHQTATVTGHVTINGEEDKLTKITLNDITFAGTVTICKFSQTPVYINLQNCHFLEGLLISGNSGTSIAIQSCTALWIDLWHCKFERTYLQKLQIEKALDVSGLELTEGLFLNEVTFDELRLIHQHNSKMWTKTPWVKTDSGIATHQFRLAGIPVFMSTADVQRILETSPSSLVLVS